MAARQQIERSVVLAASPTRVWRALTKPGFLGAAVTLDLRVGGRGRVRDADGTERQVLVAATDPPRRLVLHWCAHGEVPATVELALIPVPGGTRLAVTETALPDSPWPAALLALDAVAPA